MKLIRDMTLAEIQRAIEEEKAYMRIQRGSPGRLERLETAELEKLRQQRHYTPHNKTRLGALWPIDL